MLNDIQVQKIREFAKKKPIEVVYLFGSQTGDSARPDSDYDFGVLYKGSLSSPKRFNLNLELTGFLGEVLGQEKIDVVDLERAFPRFRFEAIKPRGEVYVRNKQIRDDFEHEVLESYLDEMYFMKQATSDYLRFFATT